MAQKRYRVVESTWVRGKRVEVEIGCDWKSEVAAKSELRQMVIAAPSRQFGIQPESRPAAI